MDAPIQVLLDDDTARQRLRADAHRGLTATPKDLPPKWFYDERGSRLFEEITALPEYYPTRAEREILTTYAAEVAELSDPACLVELGSGSATKTRVLLDALQPGAYLAFDVCEKVIRQSLDELSRAYPSLEVTGVVGDFEQHLPLVPRHARQLVAFLGSTLGNLQPEARHRFLCSVRAMLEVGDQLLLGADLVKSTTRLVAAYDDQAGVTAEFNRNVLAVLNRQLDADFDLGAFEHVAVWEPEEEWIEMRLRATSAQTVHVDALDLQVRFAPGEELRTEVSAKFRVDGLAGELKAAGFDLQADWTDTAGDFAVVLAAAV